MVDYHYYLEGEDKDQYDHLISSFLENKGEEEGHNFWVV